MKIKFDKILVKTTMKETTISEWVNPTGYKLPMVTIGNPLYDSALNVCFGKYSEFRRFLKEIYDHEIEMNEPMAVFVYFDNKKDNDRSTYFMNLQDNNWTGKDYGTICHELHHYTHISLDRLGIKHCRESEEAFAYVHGYFMERIVRAFVMLKKKK